MQQLRLKDRLVFPELNLISANSVRVHVEPKAMAVLLELAKHQGEVVSKTHLMETVWAGVFVCEDVVTNAISMLRRALVDDAKRPNLIETISKCGYRLLAPVLHDVIEPGFAEASLGGPAYGLAATAGGKGDPNNEVQRAVLRVRHLRHEETVTSLNSARAYCEEILRQEPNCAAAYAEYSLVLFLLEKLGAVRHEDIEAKVRIAVDKARCLDEHASMTLVCLAKLEYRYNWSWERAERYFREAIRMNPAEADAFTEFATLLSVERRFDESLAHVAEACRLEPISPSARLQAGHITYSSGQWALAAGHYRRLLRFTPEHVFARWGLADALVRDGQAPEAMDILREGLSLGEASPHPLLVTSLSRIRELVKPNPNNGRDSRLLLQKTSDPMLLAEFYVATGELTRAFRKLDEAVNVKHYRLAAVNMFPQFEALRQDARYGQFLKRVGMNS